MSNLEKAILGNIYELVNTADNVVEPSIPAANALMVASCEDSGDMIDMLGDQLSCPKWFDFNADMAKAFAGIMSHDDFFIKWRPVYERARQDMMDELDSKIWNTYVDVDSQEFQDPYVYNGVRREDF